MNSNVPELLSKISPESVRFQKELADFAIANKCETVIETGSGMSTLFFLNAMDRAGFGKLYSIDPQPFCGYEVVHPRYELIKKKSFQALAELYNRSWPWDLFLHDSDHWFECQTFEYNFALAAVKKGGWIFADDRTWDYSTVWQEFVKSNGLDEIIIADIAGAQKKEESLMHRYESTTFQNEMWEAAKARGAEWRKANGKPPCHMRR